MAAGSPVKKHGTGISKLQIVFRGIQAENNLTNLLILFIRVRFDKVHFLYSIRCSLLSPRKE